MVSRHIRLCNSDSCLAQLQAVNLALHRSTNQRKARSLDGRNGRRERKQCPSLKAVNSFASSLCGRARLLPHVASFGSVQA